jgi:hypothetical protein
LQIDIWSARPQLFEIWTLLKLMNWLNLRGYSVMLLKTQSVDDDGGVFRWNLSYSVEKEPCASVKDARGIEQCLYYQLYRPTGDMPDIALLESHDPSSRPIWSVDPKHSEKGGYSLSAYERTANRYRDSFGAAVSFVIEYFERPELGVANPYVFSAGSILVRDCGPGRKGFPLLLSLLAQFHPTIDRALVCIDCSESFAMSRPLVLSTFQQRIGDIKNALARSYICFAGNALVAGPIDAWIHSQDCSAFTPPNLLPGTASEPLFQTVKDAKTTIGFSSVILVTDGEFDIPIDQFIERLENNMQVKVTIYPKRG